MKSSGGCHTAERHFDEDWRQLKDRPAAGCIARVLLYSSLRLYRFGSRGPDGARPDFGRHLQRLERLELTLGRLHDDASFLDFLLTRDAPRNRRGVHPADKITSAVANSRHASATSLAATGAAIVRIRRRSGEGKNVAWVRRVRPQPSCQRDTPNFLSLPCRSCRLMIDNVGTMTKMRSRILLVFLLLTSTRAYAENWPHWRGPESTGVSTEKALPERWSDTENVAWKAPVRGLGISSPIVWGDQVFVTSQIGRSARRAGNHPTLVQGGNPSDAGERALGGARRRPMEKCRSWSPR